MLRIVSWVGGTIAAMLFLAESAQTSTIGIGFGLVWWIGGLYYAGGAGLDRTREWHFGRADILPVVLLIFLWPLAAIMFWLIDSAERLQLRTPEHDQRNR